MAKTRGGSGNRPPQTAPTGPVLVDDPPAQTDLPEPPAEDDSEEESVAAAESASPDPRRIPPSLNLTGPQMWAFIAQYPAPQDLDLYCYRLFPVIVAGPPPDWTGGSKWYTYQEKVKGLIAEQTGRVVDYEWLRNVRGSGTYHLRLIDRRLKRTQNRQVCEAKVDVNEWDAHPPVLNDWSELVPTEANKWIISRLVKDKVIKRTQEGGFVAYEGEPAAQNGNGNQSASGEAAKMFDTAARILERAYNRPPAPAPTKEESPFEKIDIVGLIDKTHSANDPVKMLAGFKDLADILKPPAAAPAADPVAMALKIIEALKPNTPAVAPLDPIAQMKVQLDMIKTIKDTFGDSEKEAAETRSRMNGWQEFFKQPLTELMSGLKPLFKVGADILFLKTNHPAPAANATPRATAPAQVAQPGAPAPAAAPEQTTAEQPQGQEEPPMMNRQQAEAHMIMTGVASVAPTLIKYFESEELTGVDFASWFCDASLPTGLPNMPMVPELVDGYDALPMLKQYGAAQIQSLIKVNAGPLYTRIAPTEDKETALLKFLEEFLSYDPEAEQPEAK
jgi:hypothetical protein